ncbi:MAG TPA: response regulator [Pyrinomonadaceae bacterium]|nr:response regulator [Pyrinomonadaceae bacterium]
MTPTDPVSQETICLVDDDPSVLKSVERLLRSDGLTVRAFSEAAPFLAYTSKSRVKLVVLDIRMKQMNGLEVLAHLCSLSPQTRIIIITGREDFATRSIADQVGAAGFFIKPLDDREFLASVHQALGHAVQGRDHLPKTKVP